jgi:hypothetical protein
MAKNASAIVTNPFILLPAALLISIAYAAVIDRFVDRYFRKLRRTYEPGIANKAPEPKAVDGSRLDSTHAMFKRYLNRRSALFAAAGVAAIGAAELAARCGGFGEPPLVIRDDKIEYYLVPSRNYTRFGHDIRVNRYGMRSDDVDLAALDRRVSFSLFGDSVVYGNRLDQADTVPARLQEFLRVKEGNQTALVNGIAAPGWGPENLLEFYKRFGPFPGNIAWIVQSTHDMVDVTHLANKDLPYRTAPPYGALHDLVLSTWHAVALSILPNKADPVKWEDKRRRADLALHALISALKADYARVILVFHATREEAVGGDAEGLEHFRAVAKDEAIEFTSTMELYGHAYRSNLPPHYDNIHLSKYGTSILSERLAADIGTVNSGY